MKNNIVRIILILCLCTVVYAAWDKDKPSSSTSLRNSNPQILANWSALETALTQDHEFSTGGTNSGEHKQIKFNAPISTPTNAADKGWLYEKNVSAVVELHWLDESDNELQMTSAGKLFSSGGLVVTGTSTFNGTATLGAGDDLIGSATSDINFNSGNFTVAGATGNTGVGGTLDVTGNIDPTTYETTNGGFLDEDAMGSDAANKVASQQSIKKYVDDFDIKAWAKVSNAGANLASYNVTSTAKNSIGNYTVTWDTDFSSTHYAVSATSLSDTGLTAQVDSQATGTVIIETRVQSTGNLVDSTFYVIAIGAQ